MRDLLRAKLLNQAAPDGDPGGAPPAGGTPPPDGGAPPPDGGTPPPDGGTPPPDGGAPPPDGGMPASWRANMLGQAGFEGDELTTRAGQLERVLDEGTLLKNYFNAQDKIRNGELSTGLPENPNEEQLASWREANDVPATVEDYNLNLGEGVVLGDEDKGIVDQVLAVGLENNVPNSAMAGMVNTFLDARDAELQQMQQNDGIHVQQTTTTLKEAWGQDYDTNVNMVKGLVNRLPEAMRGSFEGSRMADGKALFNSPEFMVFMADVSRELNPAGTVVPNSNNPVQSINDEINALETRMGDDSSAWHKDTAAQQRLQNLYEAQDKMKAT